MKSRDPYDFSSTSEPAWSELSKAVATLTGAPWLDLHKAMDALPGDLADKLAPALAGIAKAADREAAANAALAKQVAGVQAELAALTKAQAGLRPDPQTARTVAESRLELAGLAAAVGRLQSSLDAVATAPRQEPAPVVLAAEPVRQWKVTLHRDARGRSTGTATIAAAT